MWTRCFVFVSQCRHRVQFVSERLRASVRHRSDSVILRHRLGRSDLCRPTWICRRCCFKLVHQLQQHEAQQQQHDGPERTAAEAADCCCDLEPGRCQGCTVFLCPWFTWDFFTLWYWRYSCVKMCHFYIVHTVSFGVTVPSTLFVNVSWFLCVKQPNNSSSSAALTESEETTQMLDSEPSVPIWEPMLCSEAEEGQAPLSLELLYHTAQTSSPSDAIIVAGSLLMLETGFVHQVRLQTGAFSAEIIQRNPGINV